MLRYFGGQFTLLVYMSSLKSQYKSFFLLKTNDWLTPHCIMLWRATDPDIALRLLVLHGKDVWSNFTKHTHYICLYIKWFLLQVTDTGCWASASFNRSPVYFICNCMCNKGMTCGIYIKWYHECLRVFLKRTWPGVHIEQWN